MNKEKQRIKIAEACGWEWKAYADTMGWYLNGKLVWNRQVCGLDNFRIPTGPIPDYLNDLNAMHEAEKVLQNQFTTLEETYWRNLAYVKPHPIYATAAQRAVAFLRTLGKWEEATPI
jgi:hypothetical protein